MPHDVVATNGGLGQQVYHVSSMMLDVVPFMNNNLLMLLWYKYKRDREDFLESN